MSHKNSWLLAVVLIITSAGAQADEITFNARSAQSGPWSNPATWQDGRTPRAGDSVQVRPGHRVVYDVMMEQPLRVLHVAGTLSFARDRSTRLDAGLIRVQAGERIEENGFDCLDHGGDDDAMDGPVPALEIGTADEPIPPGVTATIRLVYFAGMNRETLPALINCGGRWDAHGAPMSRTWVKLGASVKPGATTVELAEPVTGWHTGDRVIVTLSKKTPTPYPKPGVTRTPSVDTEERSIVKIEGTTLVLDKPLSQRHSGEGMARSEVANLSRNVVIESAEPDGERGHTMFHRGSSGGVSYAEFRHLGKRGVLGKYSIHFHLVRDSMRGSGVIGASIWDSHNRWITIHGTDYLLVRDCVGYRSVGHGFFLEDGTEQYNVLDRNLAVQAYRGKPLPKQVLPFDPNDGAGFWWANGRNTFTRNVACENDQYGYHYEITKQSNFDPSLRVREPDGTIARRDVRTIPFYRFEDNESHGEGLYSFNFGDDKHLSVHGDRTHPFIVRNLRAWETHYALRPNIQFFLADGLNVEGAAYGVYHPEYDAQVFRNIRLKNVNSEPINRGHDDESIQYGTFTYENLTIEDSRVGRDPLIQMACTSPSPGQSGHFRNVVLRQSNSHDAQVVDLGGGPRNDELQNGVVYYFHGMPSADHAWKVVSARFPDLMKDAAYKPVRGFTGPDVRAAEVDDVPFPTLLEPVDDVPPASMITSVRMIDGECLVSGISQDNGTVARVSVNERPAEIRSQHAGVVDWQIKLPVPADGRLTVNAVDDAGNGEKTSHVRTIAKH